MKVEQIRDVTTAASAITYEVRIRISILDLKDVNFSDELIALVLRAIGGIE